MMHAIKSLKENRALLKRRRLKSKEDIYGTGSVTELEFKKATPAEMAKVKLTIIREKKKNRRINSIAAVTTAVIVILIILYITIAE